MSKRIYWNDDWKFVSDFEESMAGAEYDDSAWESVRLPHSCVETPLHYFDESVYQMVSGYRRHFLADKSWQGKKVLLTIDGAAHDSEVFLNGKSVGSHHCGYTAFTVDLSEGLKYGEENVVAVRVDSRENLNIPPFGHVIDYMTYSGIYRDVYVDIKNPEYIEDVFVRSHIRSLEKGAKVSDVQVVSEITLSEVKDNMSIRQSIRKRGEKDYELLGEAKVKGKQQMKLKFMKKEAELWNVNRPAMYEIKTELLQNGRVLDDLKVSTGFRKCVFKKDGFYLNGKKIKLCGLNRHQSYPYLGYAMPASMQRRDAIILKKELGLNAVRTSHYPQSHYFLKACDELGLLVFTEIPGWQHIGDEAWKNQAVENVKDMVLQYRNHPSIVLWGVRINESQDDDAFYIRTNAAAHELDCTRQTGGVRVLKKSHLLEDVYTFNDFSHEGGNLIISKKKNVTTDMEKPYLISEYNGHMYPTKAFDWEEHRLEHALRHSNVVDAVAGDCEIAGSFGWCMFDYNTHKDFGSGDRICYHGVMDMFRNPKLAAAVYACRQDKVPVLEVSSSMDIGEHPGGNRGDIWIFTNADYVRMYKNNHLIKEYHPEDSPYKNMIHGPILVDDFIGDTLEKEQPFKPEHAREITRILNVAARVGVTHMPKTTMLAALKVALMCRLSYMDAVNLYTHYVGDWGGESTSYRFEAIKNGRIVKIVTKEPVKKIMLDVDVDHADLYEKHSYDVAAIRIKAVDQNGNVLSFFNEPVTFETEGDIELIGPKTIALSGGMAGTYVKSVGKAGFGKLIIKSAQVAERSISFKINVRGK